MQLAVIICGRIQEGWSHKAYCEAYSKTCLVLRPPLLLLDWLVSFDVCHASVAAVYNIFHLFSLPYAIPIPYLGVEFTGVYDGIIIIKEV